MAHPRMLACLVLAAASSTYAASPLDRQQQRLASAVEAIRHADYRGDRAELVRQAKELARPIGPALEKYRDYWIGFAYWRRALNGFNETPTPDDLFSDLVLGAAAFRSALAVDPAFEDAKSGLAGCLMSEMYLATTRPEKERQAIYAEGISLLVDLRRLGSDNPRTLWILGGSAMSAPPPYGGDLAKAGAIYERGLAGARREAAAAPRPAWEPRWGAPEILMSLAWMHSHLGSVDRPVARAYALGAIAIAPDWHYVADILLPQIEALPDPGAPAATPAAGTSPPPACAPAPVDSHP